MPGGRSRAALLALGATVALWFGLQPDEAHEPVEPAADLRERTAEEPQPPMLVGPPAGAVGAEPKGPTAGAGPGARPEARRVVTLRLQQADGRPARMPRVVVGITRKGVKTERRAVRQAVDGSVRIELGQDDEVERIEVFAEGTEGPRATVRLFTWEAASGVALDAVPPIEVAWLALPVRTVDSRGDPRPHQRILFRPVKEGETPRGWWGESSDAEGRLVLGPFPPGSFVEMRPGWRGVREEDLTDAMLAWKRVELDGTEYALFVGDQPRLVLTFPRAEDEGEVRINVLDHATGKPAFPAHSHRFAKGAWHAPALKDGRAYEIVVGPTVSGQFAREVLQQVPPYPVEIRLERAPKVEGLVRPPALVEITDGYVEAMGRGFSERAPLGSDGRFAFVGLPTEPLELDAFVTVRDGRGDVRVMRGKIHRADEAWIEIPVAATEGKRKPTGVASR